MTAYPDPGSAVAADFAGVRGGSWWWWWMTDPARTGPHFMCGGGQVSLALPLF